MLRSATLALVIAALPIASAASGPGLSVPVDQSRRVPFTGVAESVVVGNPAIASTQIVSTRIILVTGKKFGVTDLKVYDAAGRTLFDREIMVSAGEGSMVTIYRGNQATDYACAPYCAATPVNPGLQPPQQAAPASTAPAPLQPPPS